MAKKVQKMNARQAAYRAKQEKEGRDVVKWIFGVLIVLAILFAAYSVYVVS